MVISPSDHAPWETGPLPTAEVPEAEPPDALAPVPCPQLHLKLPLKNQSSTWGSEDIPDVAHGVSRSLALRAKPTPSCNRQTSMEGMRHMARKSQRRFQSLQRTQSIQLERRQRDPEKPQATRHRGWGSRSRCISARHSDQIPASRQSSVRRSGPQSSMRNSSFSSRFGSSLAPF